MPTESRRINPQRSTEALYRAALAARYAPSAHNAQPWRWRLSADGLDLFADSGSTPDAAESDGSGAKDGTPGERLAAIGCGAALQHARLDLAAHGWRVTVTRQP